MTFKRGSTDPCKQEACNIQACLDKNNFNEDKCKDEIEKLKQCCRDYFEKHKFEESTETCTSPACSGFMKELEKEKKLKSK